MAFYTTRIDNNGNEIERSRLAEGGHMDYEAFDSYEQHEQQHYYQMDSCSNRVPPLDLSADNDRGGVRTPLTFSCRKKCEKAKIVLKTDEAYESWLTEKRKAQIDEAARRKKAEDAKRRKEEERERLAAEKYEQWLAAKKKKPQQQPSISMISTKKTQEPPRATSVKSPVPIAPTVPGISKSSTTMQLSQAHRQTQPVQDAKKKLDDWHRAKVKELEKRRTQQKRKEEDEAKLNAERKKQNESAWSDWVARSKNRPKPVPLNKGFFSLTGTISDIFVNPNEWQSN